MCLHLYFCVLILIRGSLLLPSQIFPVYGMDGWRIGMSSCQLWVLTSSLHMWNQQLDTHTVKITKNYNSIVAISVDYIDRNGCKFSERIENPMTEGFIFLQSTTNTLKWLFYHENHTYSLVDDAKYRSYLLQCASCQFPLCIRSDNNFKSSKWGSTRSLWWIIRGTVVLKCTKIIAEV